MLAYYKSIYKVRDMFLPSHVKIHSIWKVLWFKYMCTITGTYFAVPTYQVGTQVQVLTNVYLTAALVNSLTASHFTINDYGLANWCHCSVMLEDRRGWAKLFGVLCDDGGRKWSLWRRVVWQFGLMTEVGGEDVLSLLCDSVVWCRWQPSP